MADKVELGQIFLGVLRFSPVIISISALCSAICTAAIQLTSSLSNTLTGPVCAALSSEKCPLSLL